MLPNFIRMVWSSTILSNSEVLLRKIEFLNVRGGLLFNWLDSSWYILILSFKLGNLIDAIGDLFWAAAWGELLAVANMGLMSLLTLCGDNLAFMVSLVRLYRLFNLTIISWLVSLGGASPNWGKRDNFYSSACFLIEVLKAFERNSRQISSSKRW